jgi:hypothetical protein
MGKPLARKPTVISERGTSPDHALLKRLTDLDFVRLLSGFQLRNNDSSPSQYD